jgi:tripartite motif-containing protein 71
MRAALLGSRRPSLTWAGASIALLLLAVALNVAGESSLLAHLAVQPVALIRAAHHLAVPGGFPDGTALAVGRDGRIYVAERLPPQVRVFDAQGRELAVWDGRAGTPSLGDPTALSVLPDGRIALLDAAAKGALLLTCPADGLHCSSVQLAPLTLPQGLTPRHAGGFLIADTANDRVAVTGATGKIIATWGRYGLLPGQFREPWGIVEGPDGAIYVADYDDGLVEEFSAAGAFVREWDTDGPVGALALGGGVLYAALPDGGGLEALRLGGRDFRRLSWGPRRPLTVRRPFGLAVAPNGDLIAGDQDGLEVYTVRAP